MATPTKSAATNGVKTTKTEESGAEALARHEHDEIAPEGDLVLYLQHGGLSHRFRVESQVLTTKSSYFSTLLSGRFGEAESIAQAHAALRERYGTVPKAPTEELPVVRIEDLGRISTVKSIAALGTDFFSILHGRDLQQSPPPVANLANLAVVADRFDALDSVKAYVHHKKLFRTIDGKTTPKAEYSLSEEKVRQRLLAAVMLDHMPWVSRYSLRLILEGRVGKEYPETSALWWDLPLGVEDELMYRRECVLQTIQSVQAYFLNLYSSRERQCKLGYDSSPQCDSFQLGQMVRFFLRAGTLQILGTIAAEDEAPAGAYEGDILTLLDGLRQVSEYQIDRNHNHCGIRTRILPILDTIDVCLAHVGVCGECWADNRFGHGWSGAKRPLTWRLQDLRMYPNSFHKEWHSATQSMFSATARDWS